MNKVNADVGPEQQLISIYYCHDVPEALGNYTDHTINAKIARKARNIMRK